MAPGDGQGCLPQAQAQAQHQLPSRQTANTLLFPFFFFNMVRTYTVKFPSGALYAHGLVVSAVFPALSEKPLGLSHFVTGSIPTDADSLPLSLCPGQPPPFFL